MVFTTVNRRHDDIGPAPYQAYYDVFKTTPRFVLEAGASLDDSYPYDYDEEVVETDSENTTAKEHRREFEGLCSEVLKKFKPLVGSLRDPNGQRLYSLSSNYYIAQYLSVDAKLLVYVRFAPKAKTERVGIVVLADDDAHPAVRVLIDYAFSFQKKKSKKKGTVNIISVSQNDYYLTPIKLADKHRSSFSYEHYNEDFEPVAQRIITDLNQENDSGLVLLHGDPGTGKTTFLKHLLHTVEAKKIVYVPPDMTESLSAPAFMNFLMTNATNSILLIEDAENVLKPRDGGGNQAVSNILNISNGILGDVLKMQIVCTFNTELGNIDQALLRPGRLIAEYRFERLTQERTRNLMTKLYGDEVVWKESEMTLAEVFNFKTPPDKTKQNKVKLGFV